MLPNRPGKHGPLQPAVGRPSTAPNVPSGHGVHIEAPLGAYVPTGHRRTVVSTLPAGHAKPAGHSPSHNGVVTPDTLPKRPPGHSPLQLAVDRAEPFPYRPALQFRQLAEPAREYLPGGHGSGVDVVAPTGHTYPALQLPSQLAVERPGTLPYLPAGHGPVHEDELAPSTAPNRPIGQSLQLEAPVRE